MTEFEIKIISPADNQLIVDLLAKETQLSKGKIKDAMSKGAAWLTKGGKTKRVRRAKTMAAKGQEISLYYNEKILSTPPPPPTLICDQQQYSVWYKPAGLLSSGSRFGDHYAINRYIERLWQKPVFLVHRLDGFATGLMLLAHNKQVAGNLSEQFRNRVVKKIYKVIVVGTPKVDFTIDEPVDGRPAISHIRTLESVENHSLLEVQIETGRKHQIRKHLAGAGYPVLGDRLYGNSKFPALQLTAISLEFTCPLNHKRIEYCLPNEQHPMLSILDTH